MVKQPAKIMTVSVNTMFNGQTTCKNNDDILTLCLMAKQPAKIMTVSVNTMFNDQITCKNNDGICSHYV